MTLEPGLALSHYRLIEKLGEGGMGVVWKALDTNLDREVAIKILPEAVSTDPTQLARFEREAKLLASLNHRNIATVYGLHQQEELSFLAMELIEGRDLARTMRKRSLSTAEALEVARQIAAALEVTHEQGIVHRDLKPANIYLTHDGEAKVLDFGIARSFVAPETEQLEEADTPARTEPGTILGTVSYMSPEQARAKPLDARTDLWAFGCVLYEMLAGRAAFGGETRWDKLAAVLREEPDWSALPADTPETVRDLLRRCLEKDPGKRPADAAEIRRVLDAELALLTAPHGIPAITEPTEPLPPRRAGTLAAVSIVAMVMAVAIAVWTLWDRGAVEPAETAETVADGRSVAVLPFQSVGGGEDNAVFTAGIHDDVLNQIAKIGDLKVISRTSVMEYRDTPKSLKQIGTELGVATVLEGTVQRVGDQVRINVQLIDAASEQSQWAESYNRELTTAGIFSIQSDIAERIAVELQATLSAEERRRIDALPTDDLDAYDAYLQAMDYLNRSGFVPENLVAARRMFEQAISRDRSFALAYVGLSAAARDHYWMGGAGAEALDVSGAAARQALELAPDLPEAHMSMGTHLYVSRDYEAALEELLVAEQGLPGDAELTRRKAFIERRLNRWPAALEELLRARELDPRDALTAVELGFTLICLRHYDEARLHIEQALELVDEYAAAVVYREMIPIWRDGGLADVSAAAERIAAEKHNPWTYAHGWHAALYTRDYERALEFLSGRERIGAQWYNYPPQLLRGWTHWLYDRDAEAHDEFETARLTLEADLLEDPADARLHGALGVAYAGLGRKDDALREGRRALELLPVKKDVFVGAWQLQDLAWIQVMTGELDAAVETLDGVLSMPSVFSIESLLLDPRIDPLREDAGFQALVAKYRRSN